MGVCPRCGGQGYERVPFGPIISCERCGGTGKGDYVPRDKKLERDLEKQHEQTAALGDAQSEATGQQYEQVDEVPLSETAKDEIEAREDASNA